MCSEDGWLESVDKEAMADKEISSTKENLCPFLGSTVEMTEVHSGPGQTPSITGCRVQNCHLM